MIQWKFKPFAEDDTKENPLQSQFFTTDTVGNMANGLVREGIQNALDERLDIDRPVVVRITLLDDVGAISQADYAPYFLGLSKHLEASKLLDLPELGRQTMPVLIFEDFNTNGLKGNPIESKDEEIEDPTKAHNFYYFWRNIGISGKPEDKLGRWGVGKTVFPASSQIHTFFGYTIQADTKNALLLGQCIVKKHNLDGDDYVPWGYRPYGYYGQYEPNGYFPHPITDRQYLETFERVFQLKRDGEPGLSLVVPFFRQDITIESLLIAVIEQYFYPILRGDLEVLLTDNTGKTWEINKDTFDGCLVEAESFSRVDEDEPSKFDVRNVTRLCTFTRWTFGLCEEDFVSLKPLRTDLQPAWREELWDELQMEPLIEKFEKDQRIAFKVPVKYHNRLRAEAPRICWFKVFLERDEDLSGAEDHFIRENITIIGVHSLKFSGIRSIVLVDDRDLANLLGDSENPAHTEWQYDSEHFHNKYTDGGKCIRFIVRSPQIIASRLQKPAAGYDRDILNDIFYLPQVEEPQKKYGMRGNDEGGVSGGPAVPPLVRNPSPIAVRQLEGGFVLEGSSEAVVGHRVLIELGYMTRHGDPLTRYNAYDFQLDKKPIVISQTGVRIQRGDRNQLELEIQDEGFSVKVTGFDKKRDLFIRVTSHADVNQEI